MKVSALFPAFLNAEEPVVDYSGFKVSSRRKEIRAHLIPYNLISVPLLNVTSAAPLSVVL